MSSDDFISKITLECLMNDKQYEKYSKGIIENNICKKDLRFYRKRISALTKQLINNEETEQIFSDVVHSFDYFAKNCIEYFKMLDKRDILQEEFSGLNAINDEMNSIIETDITSVEDSNKTLFRSIKIDTHNTLDNFVKRIQPKKEVPPVIYPQQQEIDLTNPILKKKGIREKKNITNIYDGTKLQDKKKELKEIKNTTTEETKSKDEPEIKDEKNDKAEM